MTRKILKYVVLFAMLFFGLNVFAQDEDSLDFDVDSALDLNEPVLELGGEELPVKKQGLKTESELKPIGSCRCQCLIRSFDPKNRLSFRGLEIDGNCVCPCAIPNK